MKRRNSTSAPARPDLSLVRAAQARGFARVAGIDEAGRGPWAGPVVAAAVRLDPAHMPTGLNDSKLLTAATRERLYRELYDCADIGVGIAEVARIDADNILAATLWAMSQAVQALHHPPDYALVDGNRLPELVCPGEAVVRGDGRCLAIAAASIIAKTTRDRYMTTLAETFPGYGWEHNMGYGTPQHQTAIATLGVTPHHRRSFRPIRIALGLKS